MYVKRGKILPTACGECRSVDTRPYIPNLKNPHHVLWFCAAHLAQQPPSRVLSSIAETSTDLERTLASLDSSVRAALEEQASHHPLLPVAISPGTPLFRQRLAKIVHDFLKERPE